jgi:hypothetical protein
MNRREFLAVGAAAVTVRPAEAIPTAPREEVCQFFSAYFDTRFPMRVGMLLFWDGEEIGFVRRVDQETGRVEIQVPAERASLLVRRFDQHVNA